MLRLFSRSAIRAIGMPSSVEQHEAEARKQAHAGVAQRKFLLDGLDQDVENRAVEEIQRID